VDVFEAISRRRTIRDFADEEIPFVIVRKLLEAGLKAPSYDHMRRWEFIIVQDRSRREQLVRNISESKITEEATVVVDGWGLTDPLQREMYIDAIPKQQSMILSAGCLIIPCFHTRKPLLEPESLSSLNSFASIWCCIENILIAAASEGIFGVTRIPFEEERKRMKSILEVPDGYEVPCYVALGYPKKTAKRTKQHKVSVDDRVHMNAW
jgi:nitroreductase